MLYTVVLGVLYHTHNASARSAFTRHGALHRSMDAGVSKLVPDALVLIPVHSDCVVIQSTFSAALFRSSPVLSWLSKRDPLSLGVPTSEGLRGEPRKKRTFAREDLALAGWDRKVLPMEGATSRHAVEVDGAMARIRADLRRVIVSMVTTRCELNEAEDYACWQSRFPFSAKQMCRTPWTVQIWMILTLIRRFGDANIRRGLYYYIKTSR